MVLHSPPPVYARDPSLCVGIIKKADVVGMPPDAGGNDNGLPSGSAVVAILIGFRDAVDGLLELGGGSSGAGVSVATLPSSIGAGDALDGPSDAGDLAVSLSHPGVLVDRLLGNEDTNVVSLHSRKTVNLLGTGGAVDGLLCNGVMVDDSLGAGVWVDGSSWGTSFPHFGSFGDGVLEVGSSGSVGYGLLGMSI